MLGKTSAPSQAATVIHRGLLVRQRPLCETPPPPPAAVMPDPAQIQQGGDNATARENYELFVMANSLQRVPPALPAAGAGLRGVRRHGQVSHLISERQARDHNGTLSGAGDANGDYADVVEMATKSVPARSAVLLRRAIRAVRLRSAYELPGGVHARRWATT